MFVFGLFSTNQDAMKLINVSPPTEGTSWIVFGSEELSSMKSIELSTSRYPVTQFAPSYKRDTTSRAALVPGDLNNDGSNDLVACYPVTSSCYVFFGNQKDGLRNMMIGTTIYGPSSSSSSSTPAATFFGFAVGGVGDMNEDGYLDIIVSALKGKACYVLYGRPSWPNEIRINQMRLGGKISEGADGYRILADPTAVMTGLSVAGVGDMNGDGKCDIAVSVLGMVDFVVYIIWGEGTGGGNDVQLTDIGNGVNGFKVIGEQGYYTGLSVSGVGDVNKDGMSDLVVGSIPFRKNQRPKSYVIFGSSSALGDIGLGGVVDGKDVLTVVGAGFIVSGPGDVNDDGIEDIMITDVTEYLGKSNAYIISYPSKLSSPPSFIPSSHPSSEPSNLPSSEPSSLRPTNLPSSTPPSNLPTLFFNFTSSNGSLPSLRPSNKPVVRPTHIPSRRPTNQPRSARPVFNPTFPPTSPPSFRPSVVNSASPTSKQPQTITIKPTPVPSVVQNNPPFSPSPPLSEYAVRAINSSSVTGKGIVFGESGENEVFEISPFTEDGKRSGWSGTIAGRGGRKIYVIYPKDPSQPMNQIRLKDFDSGTDVIDLSRIPQMSSKAAITYKTSPLTIFLPDNQKIVFSNHQTLNELSKNNFMFSSSSVKSSSSSSSLVSSDLLLSILPLVVPLVLLFIGFKILPRLRSFEESKKMKDEENIGNKIEEKQENPLFIKFEESSPQQLTNFIINRNTSYHQRLTNDDLPEKISEHKDLDENDLIHASSSVSSGSNDDDLFDLENQSLSSEFEYNDYLSLSSQSVDSRRLADMFECHDNDNEKVD